MTNGVQALNIAFQPNCFLSWNSWTHREMHSQISEIESNKVTGRKYSRENPLIERTRSEIPDLIRMRKQPLADQFSTVRREPNQVHLKIHTTLRSSNSTTSNPEQSYWTKNFILTSFSSLRLRVPVMKLVWSVSAFTSAMHLAWSNEIHFRAH